MKRNVIVLYRVIQEWRAPIFEKLNEGDIELEVWHGPDFPGTKVVSTKKCYLFKKRKMFSFKVKMKSVNGIIAMPLSPFLFLSLLFKNPDVVVCEGASNILNSLVGFLYCKIFKKKYIWWSLGKLQNRKYDVKRSAVERLIQYVERKSDAIITYSSVGEAYFLRLGIPKEKIFKAVNVVDTQRIFDLIMERDDVYDFKNSYKEKYDFIILFVGALTKTKSIETLIEAQKILEVRYPKIGLLVVGDGPHRKHLEELVHSLGLHNVEFMGRRIDDNYKFFSIADLFVLPGLGGLAISEAMCYGLPVIVSIGDGCEVDLVTAKNGIIDQNMTITSLAENIEFFYLNRGKTKEFGSESRRVIEERYNIHTYLSKIRDAIIS